MNWYWILLLEFFIFLFGILTPDKDIPFWKIIFYIHGGIFILIEIMLLSYQICIDLNIPIMKVG